MKSLTGFDIMKDEDTYKSIYDIILGIGENWDKLTDIEQASLGEALAGKRNANALFAVLGNLDTLQGAYEKAEASAGSAAREQENYQKSLQYSLDRTKASLEELSYDLLDSDMLKEGLEVINEIIKAVDVLVQHLDPLTATLSALGIGGGVHISKNFQRFTDLGSFSSLVEQYKGLDDASFDVDKLSQDLLGLDMAQKTTLLSGTNLSKSNMELALSETDVDEKTAKLIARQATASTTTGTQTLLTTRLGNAYKGLAASLGTTTAGLSAVVGVLAIAGVAIAAVVEAQKSTDAIRESSQQFADNFKDSKTEIESYEEEIKSLQQVINDSNSSYDDSKAARERLYEIQSLLIQNYGTEKDAINLITQAVNGEADAFDKLTAKQWEAQKNEFNRQNLEGRFESWGRLFKGVSSNEELMLKELEGEDRQGVTWSINIAKEDKAYFDKLSQMYGDSMEYVGGGTGGETYQLKGNLVDILDIMHEIQSESNNLISKASIDNLDQRTKDAEKIVDGWKSFYDQYTLNEYILGKQSRYEDNYMDYLRDVEAYQKAITDPDQTEETVKNATKTVQETFNKLKEELNSDDSIGDATKQSILRAFDGIAPELQSKIGVLEIETILTTNDPKKGNVPITGANGNNLRSIIDQVKKNFQYAEEITNFQEAGSTQAQKNSYNYLKAAADQYNISLEEMVNLLKERNELESKADIEYVDKIRNGFAQLAKLSGMSDERFNAFAEGMTKDQWIEAGENVDAFITRLGLVKGTVESIIPTFDEAKRSVDEFTTGTEEASSELEDVKAVLADIKNVDQKAYASLISHSKEYSSALTIQNGRLTVNRSKLLAIANTRAKERQQTLKQASAYKKLELLKHYKELKIYDDQLIDTTDDTYEQVFALQEEITQLDLLSNSLEQATDAFSRFREAQETADSPYYETSRDAYQTIEDALDSGFVGTDDVKMAQQLLYSAEYYKKFVDAAKDGYAAQSEIAEQWQKDHAKYNTEDDFQNVKNFYDELEKSGLLQNGQLAASSVIGEYFNASADWTNSMIEKLNLLDWDGEVIKQSPIDFIDDATQALTNVTSAKQALNEAIKDGADANLLTDLEESYKKANADYESFMERIPETFSNMQEKLDRGASLSEALYGNKDGLTDVQEHNLASFLTTVGLRIDETKDKIAGLKEETDGSILDPESDAGKELAKLQSEQQQLQTIQNTLAHGMYADRSVGMDNRITNAKTLQDQLKAAQEQLKIAKTGKSTGKSASEIEAEVQGLQFALENLVNEDYMISLELDATAVENEIAALKSEISDLQDTKVSMSGSTAAQEAVQGAINAKNAQVKELEGKQADIERVVNFKPEGVENVQSAVDSIPDSKDVDVNINVHEGNLGQVSQQIKELPTTKTVSINIETSGTIPSIVKQHGWAGVNGTAHADGEWGLQANEKNSLVGELGPEGLVRDGKFYLIGKKGPERRNLKKGDVIFNHKQTEELLKNGYATERGTLVGSGFVDGTLLGNAHLKDQMNQNVDEFVFRKRGSSDISKAAKQATEDIKDDIEETTDTAEEETENFIDWIERRIKHFTTYAERYLNQAQKALDRVTNQFYSTQQKGVRAFKTFDKTINSLFKTASDSQREVMQVQEEAYVAYTNLTNAVGLDPEYQKRVKYGLMEIENVTDETLKDQITKYQDYYDKSQEALDNLIEAAEKFYHIPLDKAAEKVENLSNKIEYLGKVADNTIGYRNKNAVLDEQDRQQKLIKKAQKESNKEASANRKTAKKEAKKLALTESKENLKQSKAKLAQQKKEIKSQKSLSKLSDKQRTGLDAAINAGKALDDKTLKKYGIKKGSSAYNAISQYYETLTEAKTSKQNNNLVKRAFRDKQVIDISNFEEGSEAYKAVIKYNAAVNAQTEAWNNAKNAEEEWLHWHQVEYPKAKFDNIVNDFNHTVEMMNHDFTDYDNRVNELVKASKKVSTGYYRAQKDINAAKMEEYVLERQELENQLNQIQQYSDEWYEAYGQIKEVDNAISQLNISTMELNANMRQLYLDSFQGVRNDIEALIGEQEFLLSLMSHNKKTDNDLGYFTDEGLVNLTSGVATATMAQSKQRNTASEIQELQALLDKGELKWRDTQFESVEQLKDQIRELYGTWQSEIKDTYEAQSSIVDLMKERYQAELEMYKDLVSSKKEALSKEKELYEYQKKIAEKTKNIALLEKQLAAYAGDSSQEGQAKRQKLQKDVTNAREDLRDTEYDKYISDQQQMLDDLIGEYEERIEKKLNDFNGLLAEGIAISGEQAETTKEVLNQLASDNGYIPLKLNDFNANLVGTQGQLTAFDQYFKDVFNGDTGKLASMVTNSQNVNELVKKLANENGVVTATVNTDNLNDGTDNNKFLKAIKDSNAVDTKNITDAIKLINGKTATENAAGNDPVAIKKAEEERKKQEEAKRKAEEEAKKAAEAKTAAELAEKERLKAIEIQNQNATKTNANKVDPNASTDKATSTAKKTNNNDIKKTAEDFIKNSAKTGRAKDNGNAFGAVNTQISKWMGTGGKALSKQKVLSGAELNELAKMIGAKSKDDANFEKLLHKYGIAGFAHGGFVEAIKRNGDDGIATLKVGEAILTPTDSKNLASLVQKFDTIDVTADIMNMLKDTAKSSGGLGTPQNIDYGGVQFNFELPNVTDSKSLINAIQNDNSLQKAIQSVSVDRINNGGRLSVNRI